jgi:hypothetical protein
LYLTYSLAKHGDLYDRQLRFAQDRYRSRHPKESQQQMFFR